MEWSNGIQLFSISPGLSTIPTVNAQPPSTYVIYAVHHGCNFLAPRGGPSEKKTRVLKNSVTIKTTKVIANISDHHLLLLDCKRDRKTQTVSNFLPIDLVRSLSRHFTPTQNSSSKKFTILDMSSHVSYCFPEDDLKWREI